MELTFFTTILALGYILHKSEIITKEQLSKMIEEANNNAEMTFEETIDEIWQLLKDEKTGGKST